MWIFFIIIMLELAFIVYRLRDKEKPLKVEKNIEKLIKPHKNVQFIDYETSEEKVDKIFNA
jgi:hypothetical protein